MHSIVVIIGVILLAASTVSAENKMYLKGGKIVVETPQGVNEINYAGKENYGSRHYGSSWRTREQVDPFKEALRVFKDKSRPYYSKRVWFIDEHSGIERYYVDFTTDDRDAGPYIMPYHPYAYYLGYSPKGIKGLYGVNLVEKDNFFIDQASQFNVVTCGDHKSYIVVHQNGRLKRLIIYDHQGKKTGTGFKAGTSTEDIQKSLCL